MLDRAASDPRLRDNSKGQQPRGESQQPKSNAERTDPAAKVAAAAAAAAPPPLGGSQLLLRLEQEPEPEPEPGPSPVSDEGGPTFNPMFDPSTRPPRSVDSGDDYESTTPSDSGSEDPSFSHSDSESESDPEPPTPAEAAATAARVATRAPSTRGRAFTRLGLSPVFEKDAIGRGESNVSTSTDSVGRPAVESDAPTSVVSKRAARNQLLRHLSRGSARGSDSDMTTALSSSGGGEGGGRGGGEADAKTSGVSSRRRGELDVTAASGSSAGEGPSAAVDDRGGE